MIALSKPFTRWTKATPEERWADGRVFWVTIKCVDDGSRGVGIFAGGPQDSVALTKDVNVKDGRDYVVTHYCPVDVNWPTPAREGS